MLNGYPLDVLDGIFTGVLQIEEGENIFDIVAVDTAGTVATYTITILRDITPPTYTFSARMVEGTIVEVDGSLYTTYHGAGYARVNVTFEVSEWSRVSTFGGLGQMEGEGTLSMHLDLVEGENALSFSVVDEAGNAADGVVYRIVLDTVPPSITLDSNVDGLTTKAKNHRVLGRVEVGSTLTIDGKAVDVNADGTFSVQVDLKVGKNVIELHATDRVGQETSMNVTMTRKKESQDGPGFGDAAALAALSVVAIGAIATRRRRD
jgi:hypothetical protein